MAFAAWLAILVVIAEALHGQLPVEVSGRGVRYDRERVERMTGESEASLRRLEVEVRELWWELDEIRRRQTVPSWG